MNLNKSARELLDRYLLGVRRSLVGKKRDDIAAEIESSLLDRLEERFPGEKEISRADVMQVLEEMGSTRKVAASFSPQRCLIGPQFYPAYILFLRIIIPVVVGALTLSLIIKTLTGVDGGGNFPFIEYLGILWNGAFMAAAFVTLIFAIIERVNQGREIEDLKEFEKFNLDDLPELAEENKAPTIPGTVIELVLGVLGLAFFTYILNNDGQLPLYANPSSRMVMVRVFTESYMRFVPVIMAFTGLEVARSATLLMQGVHSSLTNWWKIVTDGANTILTIFLLRAFPLIHLEGFENLPFAAEWDFTRINSGVNTGLKVVLILSLVGTIIEIVRRMLRQARSSQA